MSRRITMEADGRPELISVESAEALAQSLYRLYQGAFAAFSLPDEPGLPDFDRLNIEQQLPWYTLARKGPELLETLEGRQMRVVARRVHALFKHPEHLAVAFEPETRISVGPDIQYAGDSEFDRALRKDPTYGLLWEMIAKHLALVMDCDEASSLVEAEQVLLGWFKRTAAQLVAA